MSLIKFKFQAEISATSLGGTRRKQIQKGLVLQG